MAPRARYVRNFLKRWIRLRPGVAAVFVKWAHTLVGCEAKKQITLISLDFERRMTDPVPWKQ